MAMGGRGPALSRRQFLGRCGVLGAAAAVGPAALARAAPPEPAAELMRLLARDTIRGLVVFAVPGPDAYSRAQGETSRTPGALEAKADELTMQALDEFLPLPDAYVNALAGAFQPVHQLLRSDTTIPLSLLMALILNFEATAVNPLAVVGPFPASPFANLRVRDKARVFEQLEDGQSDVVALLDEHAPQPLKGELSGLMKYVGATLIEFATFSPYVEFGVWDPRTRTATRRPVGWDLTNYMPGRTTPADGWAEHRGYYEGRRAVTNHPRYA
jgi:hypothetical protein